MGGRGFQGGERWSGPAQRGSSTTSRAGRVLGAAPLWTMQSRIGTVSPWHAPRSFDENQVLRTVRDRFWSTGYAGTGVDDILRDTGLGKGSLYGAFGDKHQLFLRAFQEARHVGLGPPWGRGAVGPWGRARRTDNTRG